MGHEKVAISDTYMFAANTLAKRNFHCALHTKDYLLNAEEKNKTYI